MKKSIWIVGGLVLVIVIATVLLLLPSRRQENTATVVEVVNKVDAHSHPKDDWQPAAPGMAVYGGGQVRTGATSTAQLKLLEGMVRLAADSIFTVKESTTRQGKLVTTLFLQEGRLWAHLTTGQPHEFTVETGNAVAAVRDTRFSVWVIGDTTFVSVVEGEVALTAQGGAVTVRAGQQAAVEGDQPPSLPESMGDEERALWATEGEMPQLAPPTSTPTPIPTPTKTPSPTGTPTPILIPTKTPTPTSTSTETSTSTLTPTHTQTPTPTSAPTDTPAPIVSYVYMADDGKGHRWCEPDTVTAGRIVVKRAVGRWSTPEEARAAVGDSWPPITANGQSLVVTGLERSDVEWHTNGPDDPAPGWGFSASVEIQLGPGVYSMSSLWSGDLKDCTLTVTVP